jgi:hypothetical protein
MWSDDSRRELDDGADLRIDHLDYSSWSHYTRDGGHTEVSLGVVYARVESL